MFGLDTNILIRYLVGDDQVQYEKSKRLIQRQALLGEPVLVSLLVLLETEWVLRSRYKLEKATILATFYGLLSSADLLIEDEQSAEHALYSWKNSAADFADCLIAARNQQLGCLATATFDSKAAKLHAFIQI